MTSEPASTMDNSKGFYFQKKNRSGFYLIVFPVSKQAGIQNESGSESPIYLFRSR